MKKNRAHLFYTTKKLCFFSFILLSFLSPSCSPKQEVIEGKHLDGTPKVIGTYQNKIKTGEAKFYDDGKKEMEGSYNDKLERQGKWTYWFKNRKVWSECEYKNGLKNGKSTVYFENGKKRYEGNYSNDSTIGIWKFWNEQGALVKEINY